MTLFAVANSESINNLVGPVTLAAGHAISITTDSGTNTITTAFNGGLDDLSDVDLSGVVTGDVLLKGPGNWINFPLGTITSTFVPYTGASSNVNLGTNNLICAEVLTDTVIAENLYFNSVPYNSLICTSPSSGLLAAVTIGANLSFSAGTLAVTGAALTKTDDTNVTLTLGGTPTSALLKSTSLALGWTGQLAPSRGGTGASTQVTNAICYYDGSKITTSSNATLSFIAGDVDLLITHPSVAGTAYEIVVTSSSCQYVMAYNTASTFQGICGTGATENYWTLSTAGLGLYVSASSLWFGSTSNNDLSFYRNNTERLRLTTAGIYVPDVAYLSAASPTINTMVSGTSLIQSSVRLISAYSGAASANSSYFLGSGNDGGLLQLFGAGGTIASPTALTTDSRMGGIFGRGYAATGYSNAAAAVTFHAETTFTDTSTPTYMVFATTASGATTRTEAMRITSAGNLLLGTTSTSARITLGGSPVMQTLIRNDATLTASGNNADQYGFINYNNMTFTGGSANYATGHYADLKVNVPGGATVVYAQALVAIGPTNLGAGSVTHAKALRATAPTVGTASNVAAALTNVSIGGSYANTTPPADGAIIQGYVGIGTTNPGAALDVKSNGGTINLTGTDHTYIQFYPDGAAAGRKGYLGYPAAGIDDIYVANEISGADIILLPNGGNVGIGTTGPTTKLNIKESGTNNAVVFIEPGTWGPGYYGEIRFGDANHYIRGEWGAGINIYDVNRIALTGSNVGIGTTNPGSKLQVTADANIGSNWNNSQLRIGGATNSNYRLNLGYDTTNNLGVIQSGEDGTAYKNLALNPNGGNVGIGTTNPGSRLTVIGGPISQADFADGDKFFLLGNTNSAKIAHAFGWLFSSYAGATSAGGGGSNTGAFNWFTVNGSDTFAERMRITNGGNVGIGTTTPTNLLSLANNNYIAWRNGANSGETVGITSTSSDDMQFYVTATQLTITSGGNVVIGNQNALATNATNGFMYIRTCAGTPTGTPTAYTGHVAMLYDTTNNKLYAYNGAWKSVTLT